MKNRKILSICLILTCLFVTSLEAQETELSQTQLFEQNAAKRDEYAKTIALVIEEDGANAANKETMATFYNGLGYYQVLTGQFKEAEVSIRKGFAIYPEYGYLPTNLAPALLLQGKFRKAKVVYKKWKDKPYGTDSLTYKNVFLEELKNLEAAGIIPKKRLADVAAIRQFLER